MAAIVWQQSHGALSCGTSGTGGVSSVVQLRVKGRGVCAQGGAHHKHSRVREAAVHISQHTVRQQDRGVIVVGGSIERGDLTGDSH